MKIFFKWLFGKSSKKESRISIQQAEELIRKAQNGKGSVDLNLNLSIEDWIIIAEKFPRLKAQIYNSLNINPSHLPPPNFIAIDFETANSERSSACSLGIVICKNGEIIDKKHFLINPGDIEWSGINMGTHSIRPHHVKDAPTFKELWPTIQLYFESNLIIAHNAASFDISVLRSCLLKHKIAIPPLTYTCTMEAAKKLGWNSKLKDLCEINGISINHHDALSDAEACASLVRIINEKAGFEKTFKIREVNTKPVRKSPNHIPTFNYLEYDFKLISLHKESKTLNVTNDFWENKTVVVSGDFMKFPDRVELKELLVQKGCRVVTSVSGKTDLFIIGQSAGPKKLKDVLEYNANGKNIEIINENTLYEIFGL